MGRILMYRRSRCWRCSSLSSFVVLEHGGEGLGVVKTIQLRELTSAANAYDGSNVTVTGTLVYSNDLKKFELTEDNSKYPVPIEGLTDEQLTPLVNEQVVVAGKFVYEKDNGTHIEAESIHLADASATTPSPTPLGL